VIKAAALLLDGFSRVRAVVDEVIPGRPGGALVWRPDGESNSLGWLAWHLTRVQDSQLAELAGSEQVWTSGGWYERFDLPLDPGVTGYGQPPEEAGALPIRSAELLTAYHDAVSRRTSAYLATITEADLDRIVDDSYRPPVTLGTRLVSVLADDLQHAGQLSYLAGLLDRR
jgi:hypothetical protein